MGAKKIGADSRQTYIAFDIRGDDMLGFIKFATEHGTGMHIGDIFNQIIAIEVPE